MLQRADSRAQNITLNAKIVEFWCDLGGIRTPVAWQMIGVISSFKFENFSVPY